MTVFWDITNDRADTEDSASLQPIPKVEFTLFI